MTDTNYDAIIVGAGISGAILALKLGQAGKKVLILEAGPAVPPNRSAYMQNFFMANAKTPESPYPSTEDTVLEPGREATPRATILGLNNFTDPNKSYLVQPTPDPEQKATNLPFASTYERVGGGTTWHWLGTSLRYVPDDIRMKSTFDPIGEGDWTDWPIEVDELSELYGEAENKIIGVAASVEEQEPLESAIGMVYPPGYEYSLQAIPQSVVDQTFSEAVSGMEAPDDQPIFVSPTPQGRNSQPFQNRRTCAGNTNCIPICPIQAKYDATVTLAEALNTGNVTVQYQSVVTKVIIDDNGNVSGVDYLEWDKELDPTGTPGSATATIYAVAAHAIETPKLLLMSATSAWPNGVANSSGYVGTCLMDHVIYLSWALADKPVYPYRGPLSTSGIESLRTGPFRHDRSAFRIEIGNEGWNWAVGDPWTTTQDLVSGTNVSNTNPFSPPDNPSDEVPRVYAGAELVQALNDRLTRQIRMGFLIEQSPMQANRVVLDPTQTDGLGLPRPQIHQYEFDEYVLNGFRAARQISSEIYQSLGATEYTDYSQSEGQAGFFRLDGEPCMFFGAGHLIGTHRMGTDPATSVVNADQRTWDHENLWLVGCGSFPTEAAANPTLTLAAITLKAAAAMIAALED